MLGDYKHAINYMRSNTCDQLHAINYMLGDYNRAINYMLGDYNNATWCLGVPTVQFVGESTNEGSRPERLDYGPD